MSTKENTNEFKYYTENQEEDGTPGYESVCKLLTMLLASSYSAIFATVVAYHYNPPVISTILTISLATDIIIMISYLSFKIYDLIYEGENTSVV